MTTKLFATLSIVLWLLFPGWSPANDGYPRNPDVDIIHYCFHIFLNDSTDRIEGSAEITCKLTRMTNTVELDLTGLNGRGTGMVINRVTAANQEITWRHEKNRVQIELPDSLNRADTTSITINYAGIPADGLIISKNKYGDRTFFGDNWPDRARNWLPCVDHPSDKATVEFIVSAPERYSVVGNGTLMAEFPENRDHKSRNRVTHWKEDVPLPTKVMVIGAADFAWETVGFSRGIPVQSWVYAEDRLPGFIDYRPAADILTFYQDLIGPYSFEKLANVQSKTMFGGMENSGCIFYYEGSVTGKNQLHRLLAHEIAHQWFGDAVTESDWHHIWLSEGFATYLDAVYADSMIPGQKLSANMADMRKSVIRYAVKNHQPVIDTTITNNMDLLSTNSYQKGAWFLHMLRKELGNDIFWSGIRKFYSTYRNKNALTADFQSVMEEVSGKPLTSFFHQWLEVPGHPVIQWSWSYDKNKSTVNIDLEQLQNHHNFAFEFPLELCLDTASLNPVRTSKPVYIEIPVNTRKVHFSLAVASPVLGIRTDPNTAMLFQEILSIGK